MKSVESNGLTPKLRGGVTGKGFLPGRSGNPGGRPKTPFSQYIRDKTENGSILVDYVLSVFRDRKLSAFERMQAVTWLADRGFGRPPYALDVHESDQPKTFIEWAYGLDDNGNKIGVGAFDADVETNQDESTSV
jgi:hypothetical protein